MAESTPLTTAEVYAFLNDLLGDAHDEEEQRTALEQEISDALQSAAEVYVLGELMSLVGVSFDGDVRRGLVACCRRDDERATICEKHRSSRKRVRFSPGCSKLTCAAWMRMRIWEAYRALHHFEVGVRIGKLSVDDSFDGLLPWFKLDNRPFLRCLNGYGLCLWRFERWEEAQKPFETLLDLDPEDALDAGSSLQLVVAHEHWAED